MGTVEELDEAGVLELQDGARRRRGAILAFIPAHCGRPCRRLDHQWRLVAKKVIPRTHRLKGI